MTNVLFKRNRNVKTNKVVIKSISFDQMTLESSGIGYEVIDLEKNKLFKHEGQMTEWDIEDNYENFWNRLNDLETGWTGADIVKVIKVYPYKEFIRKGGGRLLKKKEGFHKVHYTNSNPLLKNKVVLPITW
jgi:hypothetical protein